MRKYNKLVRDKIIEHIISKGGKPVFRKAKNDKEHWQYCLKKLKEEVGEFTKNPNIVEMADIEEILDEICEFKKFDKKELLKIKRKKAKERGKFKKRIILEES